MTTKYVFRCEEGRQMPAGGTVKDVVDFAAKTADFAGWIVEGGEGW